MRYLILAAAIFTIGRGMSGKSVKIEDHLLNAVMQVESGGGKYLVSPVGARGPFQFMPKTAKAYNVDPTDDNWEDDRRGASELLRDEWVALGSLELALAAYNTGRPNVLKAIKKAGSKEWGLVSKFLPLETRLYVPKVLKAFEQFKSGVLSA